MAATDISILSALASRIGEKAVVEMAQAYIAIVNDRRAGIEPPAWSRDFQETFINKYVAAVDSRRTDAVSAAQRRLDLITRLEKEMKAATSSNIGALHAAIIDAQWNGMTKEPVYIDACSRLDALYAVGK